MNGNGSGARRPVIGISAYCEQARWGPWDQQATLLPQEYIDQVVAAGGIPVLLPPVPGVQAAIDRLDALIISGGPDVEPGRYGQPPGPRTTVVRPERDAAEMELFRGTLGAGLPVLGVCRGMQLMNVALGGTLTQHLPDVVGHEGHSPTPGTMAEHKVLIGSSGVIASLLGDGAAGEGPAGQRSLLVPTHHHQGIDRLAPGLAATAWAEDGTIEAVELEAAGDSALAGRMLSADRVPSVAGGSRFVVGVQWHPEAGTDPSLFRAIVAAASERIAQFAR